MSKFQLIVIVVFGFIIVFGVALFALSKGSSSSANRTPTIIWGTISKNTIDGLIEKTRQIDDKLDVSYVEKRPESFEGDLVEALASGAGPDAIVISEDLLYKNLNKLFLIPYQTLSEREFKDTYISEAELFLFPNGIAAIPLAVDPLVMYWNRTILNNNAISKPPTNWTEFLTLAPKLTKQNNNVITQATVAFGGFDNISNAKAVLSALFLQAGTPITVKDTKTGVLKSVLGERFNFKLIPAEEAIRFYTGFADPQKPNYSWNPSLPSSQSYFVSGDLAFYFGLASEAGEIRVKNPNLDFDITLLPQTSADNKITYGKIYGLALTRGVRNVAGSFINLRSLTSAPAMAELANLWVLPPARRDLLVSRPSGAFRAVFYDSALIARSWLDPDSSGTNQIFRAMIKAVTSGLGKISEATRQASLEIDGLIK